MSTPRRVLADRLTTELGAEYRVVGWAKGMDRLDRRTVMVWTDTLAPTGIGSDRLDLTLAVWVLTPHTTAELADDDLDEALAEVLAALLTLDVFAWTSATRDVWDDAWHGYRIEVRAAGDVAPAVNDQLTPDPAAPTTVEDTAP